MMKKNPIDDIMLEQGFNDEEAKTFLSNFDMSKGNSSSVL